MMWFGRDWSIFWKNHSKSTLLCPSNHEKWSDFDKNRREGWHYGLFGESVGFFAIASLVWPIWSEEGLKNKVKRGKNDVSVMAHILATKIAFERRFPDHERGWNSEEPCQKWFFVKTTPLALKIRLKSGQNWIFGKLKKVRFTATADITTTLIGMKKTTPFS